MSINDQSSLGKGEESTIFEEEFDIVPVGKSGGISAKQHILNIIIIVLVATAAFGLGRIQSLKNTKVPVKIENIKEISPDVKDVSQNNIVPKQEAAAASVVTSETVIGSKNSNKYHYLWCPGAKQISEANKIYFGSIDEARKAGYVPASNCKGLK